MALEAKFLDLYSVVRLSIANIIEILQTRNSSIKNTPLPCRDQKIMDHGQITCEKKIDVKDMGTFHREPFNTNKSI